ncbi:class I SAM-dependent methyltransferase [Pseudoalteromonas sp. M8]|uniref:class I SAM-dependent methyltransferase n=1 Tax=Pseudoalteromonas sp. M8 TaxID=2692624 RepID=UPI001BA80EC3|nr:class I SAM-dependent methyltransferase [Pseudoalteromonas sp. M8]QUI70395.1 methyltransferase domain-containing protein [Pseudoalteromonas sp. M8]
MTELNNEDYEQIKNFYNDRFYAQGDCIGSVGWRDQATQFLRFERLINTLKLDNKTILDIGCGLGDLVHFLDANQVQNYRYVGIDIADKMIEQASSRFSGRDNVEFFAGDIFEFADANEHKQIDIALSSGMLSYKISDNLAHAQRVITKTFSIVHETMAFNFLSDQVDYQLDKNFHYNSLDILGWIKPLTNKFVLDQNYPLWEFTLQVFKPGRNI